MYEEITKNIKYYFVLKIRDLEIFFVLRKFEYVGLLSWICYMLSVGFAWTYLTVQNVNTNSKLSNKPRSQEDKKISLFNCIFILYHPWLYYLFEPLSSYYCSLIFDYPIYLYIFIFFIWRRQWLSMQNVVFWNVWFCF